MEDSEYGSWIRATPSPPNRKSVVRIPGFYEARKKTMTTTKAQASKQGGGTEAERVVERRSDRPTMVEETQVDVDASLAEKFNETAWRIKFRKLMMN